MDNYYTRSLLGEEAFNAPIGSLLIHNEGEADAAAPPQGAGALGAARAALASVDVLLDSGLPHADDANLRYGLGWRLAGLGDVRAKASV